MRTVVRFPDRSVLAEEAAEWLIRLDAEAAPKEHELKALGEWLHRSPAHREELENLASLWGRMNVLTELAVPLDKAGRRSGRGGHKEPAAPNGRWRSKWVLAASVSVAIVAAFAVDLMTSTGTPDTDSQLATNGLYATAIGQQKTTTLADGSAVILNTNSQIRVNYTGEYRQLYLLHGEALFTVAKDAERPFRVYAGSGRIEALGTAFAVYLNGQDVDVTVSEGRVSVVSVEPSFGGPVDREGAPFGPDSEGGVVPLGTLNAGQVATIRSSHMETDSREGAVLEIDAPIPPEELAERLAWSKGVVMFSGDTLEEVVNEISRYTTMSFEIPDVELRNMRVGGRFPVGETEKMLTALEANFNLRVTRLRHNRVVLSAADE